MSTNRPPDGTCGNSAETKVWNNSSSKPSPDCSTTAAGTLLIGVTDSREPVGLDDDYAHVKPPNADGYVNWLDTLFENHLGHAGANRLDIRIDRINSHDICRIDIPASSRPMWVKKKKGTNALYQRRNNSTRQVPADEIKTFITERFGQQESGAPS